MNRALGKNGPLVAAIGLGCMGMSGAYGVMSKKFPQRAYDQNITVLRQKAKSKPAII